MSLQKVLKEECIKSKSIRRVYERTVIFKHEDFYEPKLNDGLHYSQGNLKIKEHKEAYLLCSLVLVETKDNGIQILKDRYEK